jgi:hypothetical protein
MYCPAMAEYASRTGRLTATAYGADRVAERKDSGAGMVNLLSCGGSSWGFLA